MLLLSRLAENLFWIGRYLERAENTARTLNVSYYATLETTQKGALDVTLWLDWFLGCLDRAFDGAETTLTHVMRKARFWEALAGQTLSERQSTVINRLLDGFEGKLTSTKWAALTRSSPDTALRDINDLVGRGILVKDEGGGRSTSYSLVDRG